MHFITTSTLGGSKCNVLIGLLATSFASLLVAPSASSIATSSASSFLLTLSSRVSVASHFYLDVSEFLFHLETTRLSTLHWCRDFFDGIMTLLYYSDQEGIFKPFESGSLLLGVMLQRMRLHLRKNSRENKSWQ